MSGTPAGAGEDAPPPGRDRHPGGRPHPRLGGPRRRLADSLKSRMALVLGLVLFPAAAYAVLQAVAAYNEQARQQADDLRHAAARVSAAYAEAAARLEQVAARPDLGGGSAVDPVAAALAAVFPSCADLLRGELARAERFFADLLLVDAAGRVACASADRLVGLDLAAAGWFRQAGGGGGSLGLGRAEGLGPTTTGTLVLAMPLRGGGRFGGALAATLPPERPLAGLELPPGTVARLVGRNGGPPGPADEAGRAASPTPDEVRRRLLEAPGTAVVLRPGPGGGRFRFVAAPIAAGGSVSGLHALVGVAAPRWAWLGRELVLGLLVPVSTLALAVIAIWIATDYLVNRHVQALAAAARDYAAAKHAGGTGDHAGWPALPDAPAELRDLAAVLADTTGELGAREAELEASLRHKELLLREVHHRVRNNLQVVTSLLNLRAQAAAASPAARDALIEAQARIKALALVHRDLYEGEEPGAVELRPLLAELCALLEDTVSGRLTGAAAAVDVAVRVELVPARVAVDRAVPIALFLTEALSNALRHAFPGDGSGGTVAVRLARDEAAGTARLTVEDDGVGLGPPPSTAGAGRAGRVGGLGMTLMRMLAGQAGGRLQVGSAREDGTGTRVGLDFPLAAAAHRPAVAVSTAVPARMAPASPASAPPVPA